MCREEVAWQTLDPPTTVPGRPGRALGGPHSCGGRPTGAQIHFASHLTHCILDTLALLITGESRFKILCQLGQAGSWGKDTVRQEHFGMLSTSHFAPTALSSDWILLFNLGYKYSVVIMKNQPGTVK